MLDENKKLYQSCASLRIPNWESLSKNELCNLYIQNESNPSLSEAYLSAILCKYWGLMSKYLSMSYNVATEDDVYEWLLSSVLYALKHRSWMNPNSSIYNDPNGPDKVINRCMKCRRLTFYQAINRKKRKNGVLSLSLDQIKDEYNDGTEYFTDESVVDEDNTSYLNDYIGTLFKENDVISAILFDLMANNDVFNITVHKDNVVHGEFAFGKLIKRLHEINNSYCENFSYVYHIDEDVVKEKISKCLQYYNNLKPDEFKKQIQHQIDILKSYSYFDNHKISDKPREGELFS